MNARQAIQQVFLLWPIRILVRAVIASMSFASRVVGNAKLMALAPQAKGTVCHWSVELKTPENISFGQHVVIGPGCTIGAHAAIELADYVRISKDVVIETAGLDFSTPPPYQHVAKPISIGRGVWIGTRAVILGGVTIGEYAIIGAGVVVSRDIPPYAVVTGSPSRMRLKAPSPSSQ